MNIKFFFQFFRLSLFILIYSCSSGNLDKIIVPQAVTGWCSPIQLSNEGSNKIDLSPYFFEKYTIDSVFFENQKLDLDSKCVELNPVTLNSFLSALKVYVDNVPYHILVKAPDVQETITGTAQILEIFKVSGAGKVAGSKITEGEINSNSDVRIIRDGAIIYTGKVSTIFREKNQVKQVSDGQECGITVKDYIDFQKNDTIEAFSVTSTERSI